MKNYKKIVFAVAIAIAMLIILPFSLPARTYVQKAERIASEKLGVPVMIAAGHVRFLPSPRLLVKSIVIGSQQEMKVAELVIVPALSTLFSETKQFDLQLVHPTVKQSALPIIADLTNKNTEKSTEMRVHIRHIHIHTLQFDWPEAPLPALNADVRLTASNALDSANVQSLDNKLNMHVKPDGNAYWIDVVANQWTLPMHTPFVLDKAKLKMRLEAHQLTIPEIDIALYRGKLTGDAILSWHENKGANDWKARGQFKIADLSLKEPSSLLSKNMQLSGRLSGHGHFSASAKAINQLSERLQANFQFNVKQGVLHGLDLVKIASLLVKQSQSGGETQFDAFSGQLSVSGKQYHLQGLNIRSGLLAATGQVKIKPNQDLDGVIAVEVKNSVSMVAIPLNVSGTVDKPIVLPSKAALAGAAAGTAILGPGVGTSIGIKAAGALDSVKKALGADK